MWACGLSYAAQYLTDGVIARAAVPTLLDFGNVDEFTIADDLVAAGLWEFHPAGYVIHDYLDYNPSKAQVLAERAAKQAAGRAGGQASAQARAQAEPQQSHSRRSTESVAKSKPVTVPVPVSDSVSPETVQDARDDERWNDPEAEALQRLAKHGCDIRPGNGFHRHLITLVEVHGVNAVVGMFDRLAGAGMKQGDTQGYVFGAKDALNAKSRPDLRAIDRDESAQERADIRSRRIHEGMWARRIERFRNTGEWEPEWGEPPVIEGVQA